MCTIMPGCKLGKTELERWYSRTHNTLQNLFTWMNYLVLERRKLADRNTKTTSCLINMGSVQDELYP